MPSDPKGPTAPDLLYQDVFNKAPIGIYTLNKEGVVESFNPKMVELSGARGPEQAIGLNVLTLPSYKKAGLLPYLKEGLAGKPFTVDSVEYVSFTGGKRSVRKYTGIPIKNEPGEVTRLLLLVEDVTETDDLLKRLRDSEERYRVIFEKANDGIFTLSPEGFFTSANSKAEEMTGYRFEEVKGKHFATIGLIAPKDIPKTLKEFAKRLAGILSHPYEIGLIKKGGGRISVEINSAFIKKDGRIVETMGIIRDVTERKRLEEMRLEFISLASHQLLEPLSGIRLALATVLEGQLEPVGGETRDVLAQALETVDRQALLVSNFLDLAKIEGGKMVFKLAPTELPSLVEKVVGEFQGPAQRKGIALLFDRGQTAWPEVLTDAGKLSIVLDNLVSNAVKYTEKGAIRISLTRVEDRLVVSIADSGLGIPKEDQSHLFEKFYRLHGEIRGTGLGLYLSRMIAEKMQAKLWLLKSVGGKGSTFAVSLPVAKN